MNTIDEYIIELEKHGFTESKHEKESNVSPKLAMVSRKFYRKVSYLDIKCQQNDDLQLKIDLTSTSVPNKDEPVLSSEISITLKINGYWQSVSRYGIYLDDLVDNIGEHTMNLLRMLESIR